MAIDFRCENCGKLLSVEAEPSSKIRCPYCKTRVLVPAGLASLPRPQVTGQADRDASHSAPPPVEEEILAPEGQDALMGVMATLMPWVISLFFHAGILVILAFIMIVTSRTVLKANVVVPDVPLSENLSESIVGDTSPELTAKAIKADDRWARRDSRIPSASLGRTENKISLYGSMGGAAGGGANAPLGLLAGGGKPKSRFFGLRGGAYHIVYVVDRSGSMLTDFDMVRLEMITSISRLSERQTFHVIFFASGKPEENPSKRLVYASVHSKRGALKYLKGIVPMSSGGITDPIPALKRAFAVLNKTPGKKKGKLLYLLTDGDFHDNEKVCRVIKALNAKGNVQINTVLFAFGAPEAEQMLKKIAGENRGDFKFVEVDE